MENGEKDLPRAGTSPESLCWKKLGGKLVVRGMNVLYLSGVNIGQMGVFLSQCISIWCGQWKCLGVKPTQASFGCAITRADGIPRGSEDWKPVWGMGGDINLTPIYRACTDSRWGLAVGIWKLRW